MARLTYLERRGATYYARLDIPLDLVEHYGTTTKKKSLRTKDEDAAKRLLWPVIEAWRADFDDVRSRREITADDKAGATWQHYTATLERDERARRAMPTEADLEAEERKIWRRIEAGEIGSHDFIGMINAHADYNLLAMQRDLDANARRRRLDVLKGHLVTGETKLVSDAVADFVRTNRLLVEPNSDNWLDLCRRFIRAEVEGLERTLERDRGDYSGAPKDPIVTPATGTTREQAASGETIMELFEQYAAENPKGIKADTLNQARRDVGTFVDHVGSTCPAHRIDKKAVREWKALLLKFPVKATESKAFVGMRLAQIVKHNETVGKPIISTNTVNRYLSSLGAFCGWLVDHGYLDANPVADMFLAKDKRRNKPVFTVDQMNTLFRSPLFTGCQSEEAPRFWAMPGNVIIRDHRFWLPLIMLYSGARPAEIAQLAVTDVRQQHGHWIMHITEEGEGDDKSTKTEGSMRVVPVHPELIKLGFIEYRNGIEKAGETRLFPLAGRNERGQMIADYSREFPRYLERIGLKVGRGLSLYSFRHGATDALRRAGYLDDYFGFILGHDKATTTGRYGILPQGMLEQRVELVNAIAYPGLALDHLYAPT
jgi:integrase